MEKKYSYPKVLQSVNVNISQKKYFNRISSGVLKNNVENVYSYLYRKDNKLPSQYVGDRIIANRNFMNFNDYTNRVINFPFRDKYVEISGDLSLENTIDKVLQPTNGRLLKISKSMKSPSQDEKLKILEQKSRDVLRPRLRREVSSNADKTFDAPNISENYKNVLDWSQNNLLAVALGRDVYVLDMGTLQVKIIQELPFHYSSDVEYSCVKWVKNGILLGTSNGFLSMLSEKSYDLIHEYCPDNLKSLKAVSAVTQLNGTVTLGRIDGSLEHYTKDGVLLYRTSIHIKKILRLKWNLVSLNIRRLAIVSSNMVSCYWCCSNLKQEPSLVCAEKDGDGKFIDAEWSPASVNLIAVACVGEQNKLKIVDIRYSTCLCYILLQSEITSILWSISTKYEIAVATVTDLGLSCPLLLIHTGFNENEANICNFESNTMCILKTLRGHNAPVICMASGPTHLTICTASIDQTISLWRCFPPACRRAKIQTNNKCYTNMEDVFRNIRLV